MNKIKIKYNKLKIEEKLNKIRISAVQYPIEYGKTVADYLKKIESFIESAVKEKSNLVIFPELTCLDLIDNKSDQAETDQFLVIAKQFSFLVGQIRQWSKEKDISILMGTIPRIVDKKVLNTAILVFPNGETIFQDKLNLTPDEKAWGWSSGDTLQVFQSDWGMAAILICYDIQFAVLSSALSKQQLDLILVPSMTTEFGFNRVRWCAQARSIEHHAYVILTGDVNGEIVKDFYGQSAFISPQDVGFSKTPTVGPLNKSGVLSADCDLEKIRKSKQSTGLYSAKTSSHTKIIN
jgi:predicted amidohydrolase